MCTKKCSKICGKVTDEYKAQQRFMTDKNMRIYLMMASGNYKDLEINIYVNDDIYVWHDDSDESSILVSPSQYISYKDWLDERPLLKALL